MLNGIEILADAITDIGADHVDRAMRKVDQVRDAVDQRQPDREQGVDIADDETIDGVVEPGAERRDHHWPMASSRQPTCRPRP